MLKSYIKLCETLYIEVFLLPLMPTIVTNSFNLKHTLESGQLFRFQKNKQAYLVQHRDKIFEIKQRKNKIYTNEKRRFIKHFFRLDEDHDLILNKINKDETINKAINKYQGLRLMRQDPWECIISFLCSSASNIPKIKKNIELLSKFFGKPMEYNKTTYFAFPEVNKLNNIKKIKAAATGFRAGYIYKTNKLVSSKFLNKLKRLSFNHAKNRLITFPGVGEKIADCILLFSLNHLNAFPIDTWMKKGLQKHYPTITPKSYFGKYAGYAQQYLYHYWRLK